MSELKGQWALVTGASSGLGVDFARELARRGADIVLVARRIEALQRLSEELQALGVQVRVMPTDLGDAEAREQLQRELDAAAIAIDILVNNAGFGLYGDFLRTDWARTEQMLQLDVVALTHLTRLFLPGMVQRRQGYVLQVASIGAFQPSPTYAAYAAAKSYVLNFGVALNDELRGSGVSCTVVSPGVTATEFLQVAGQKRNWFHNATMMTSADVAAIGVRAMLKRRASVVTGWLNTLMALSTRLTPLTWMAAISRWAMKA